MAMPKIIRTIDDAAGPIRKREPFQSRVRKTPYGDFVSLSGVLASKPYVSLGRHPDDDGTDALRSLFRGHLPPEYHDSLAQADFIVYSYDTPIAWHIGRPDTLTAETIEAWLSDDAGHGVWIIPEVRYTVTTTSHQSTVSGAIGGYAYGLYGKNADGTTNYSTRAPVLPHKALAVVGAPERVEYVGCERSGY